MKNNEQQSSFIIPKTHFEQNEIRPVSPNLNQQGQKLNITEKLIETKEQVEDEHIFAKNQKKISKPETKHVQQKQSPEQSNKDFSQNPIERRIFNLMKHWYPLRFKIPYPRKSLLNAYEQKEFIEFYNRFKNRTKISQSEVRLFKKYLVRKMF